MAKAWTEEEIEFLSKNAGKLSYTQIAEKLDRTEKSVNKKAFTLGIKGKKQPWTEKEDEFIDANAGTQTIQWIAKKLNRPIEGLRVHMIELGVGDLHFEMGSYSAKALGEIINVSYETVRRWVMDKGLKAKKKSRNQGVDRESMHYHILAEDFWKWAAKNKDIVEFNKIPLDALPPEPEWVMYERRAQFYKPAKQKIWTSKEDATLLDYYYKQALKQREIADKMGRTQSSVEKRLKRLREG